MPLAPSKSPAKRRIRNGKGNGHRQNGRSRRVREAQAIGVVHTLPNQYRHGGYLDSSSDETHKISASLFGGNGCPPWFRVWAITQGLGLAHDKLTDADWARVLFESETGPRVDGYGLPVSTFEELGGIDYVTSICVPAGIGDISWCYSKLKHLVTQIGRKILIYVPADEPRRAHDFIRLLPGCHWGGYIRDRGSWQ